MQFGTSLSSLAQSLIISLWFDPVDYHDYPSHGCHVISCVDYIPHLLSVSYTLTKWYQEPGYDKQWKNTGRGYDRRQEAEQKQVEIMDKEVNQAARDSDDTLVCFIKNTVEDHIMDSGALFHATYCKEELKGVVDVVLKSYFGTSWTLKDVRYIPSLKRRLISAGQLDEEGYHVGFKDQQWKVTKGSLVVAYGNKRRSLYMVEVHPERIGAIINCNGSATVWFGEAEESFLHNVSEDKETAEVSKFIQKAMALHLLHRSKDLATMILLSKTAAGVEVEAPKMLWADLVSTAYLIYCIPYVLIGLRIPEEEWRGKDTSLAHLKAVAQMKCDTAFGIRRVTRLSEVEILHLWTRFMKPENDNIVAKHGLSSEITQSLGGSSDTSEGSKNSGSYEDSGRSDEEYSEDGASSKEGGSETPHVRRSTKESKASWKKAIIEEMVSLEKNQTCSLNEEPCRDVHQVGDEREVKVLRSFNWPLSKLITEDGILPERE
ncbi:retrovirus-related pol polyprotein from transposon TNT 1-94, partial [Tanacetum coccineum]